jgi:formylglycine-generating enzyme required for sulfatase activity
MNLPDSPLRILPLLLSLAFFASLCPAQQKATGYIQVTCEPGIKIFLDGTFKGVTNADVGGLILEGVPAGTHQLRMVKEGFNPSEAAVKVEAGKVFEFKVSPFVPKLKITQRGDSDVTLVARPSGSLKIQSLPIGCRITIKDLGISNSPKTQDEWIVTEIPVGSFFATFEALGKETTHAFKIESDLETHLFVNILAGKVEDRTVRPVPLADVEGKPITIPGILLELLPVPAGKFQMGSPASEEARSGDETQRSVILSKPFWMGKYEVTQAQWKAVMESNPSYFTGDKLPVEKVSWDDAMEFCKRVQVKEAAAGRLPSGYAYTLPTEAQWEFTCRAGTTGPYAGASLDTMGWYGDNSGNKTLDVGLKDANPWGFHDMHGNVFEWCYDWFDDYPTGSITDPVSPSRGSIRVCRGGCWCVDAWCCRSAYRGWYYPDRRSNRLGFRLCLSPVKK